MLRSPERGLKGITREKSSMAMGQDHIVIGILEAIEHSGGSRKGLHVRGVLSLILPVLYLGCVIWWDCLLFV